jgi:deoxyribodipyrimidine photo-lyase
VAGTGTDASPYYRVFNPTTQSRKFDPEGDYLRRWVPEIAHLRGAHLHDPSSSTGGGPSEYPAPIVDHARARAEALARYERRAKRR